jgi:hypothetical protein
MNKSVCLLMCFLVLLVCAKQELYTFAEPLGAFIHDIKQQLIDKYCPMFGFDGKECPLEYHYSNKKNKENDAHIIGAGRGYNRVTRELLFPIFKETIVVHLPIAEKQEYAYRFKEPSEFLDVLDKNQTLGGLFAESMDWLKTFLLSTFNDYKGDMSVALVEYHTHTSSVIITREVHPGVNGLDWYTGFPSITESLEYLDKVMREKYGHYYNEKYEHHNQEEHEEKEKQSLLNNGKKEKHTKYSSFDIVNKDTLYAHEFETFLQVLPDTYDASNETHVQLFSLLFDLFGTHVITSAKHGGVIYRQDMVKRCFSDSITNETMKELEKDIRFEPHGPSVYARFRKIGLLDIKGGNPDVHTNKKQATGFSSISAQELKARMDSFASAPALVRFEHEALDQVVPEKASIKQALQDYYTRHQDNWQSTLEARIKQEQLNEWLKPKQVQVYQTIPSYIGPFGPHEPPCSECNVEGTTFRAECFTRIYEEENITIHTKWPYWYMPGGIPLLYISRNNITGDTRIHDSTTNLTIITADRYYQTLGNKHFVFDCEPGCKYEEFGHCGFKHCRFTCNCKGY